MRDLGKRVDRLETRFGRLFGARAQMDRRIIIPGEDPVFWAEDTRRPGEPVLDIPGLDDRWETAPGVPRTDLPPGFPNCDLWPTPEEFEAFHAQPE